LKAVILLSGGLDSSTVLYQAASEGYECYAISFDYQQRHRRELEAALTDEAIEIPEHRSLDQMSQNIPITYVPARNTIFLSFGLSYAEATGAQRVYVGVNALDYSGYPDCRPDYIQAMQRVFNLGTKQGREGKEIAIATPLINLKKTAIIELGNRLGVPWKETWSCYTGGDMACGVCDSCQLRLAAFAELGLKDPVPYTLRHEARGE
jgi:7-cyano-7-deazaguanine synthase